MDLLFNNIPILTFIYPCFMNYILICIFCIIHDLGVVHYLLIRGMVSLDHWDMFPMVSVLVCMVTHRVGHTVGYDVRL